jgi:hypothetical protein
VSIRNTIFGSRADVAASRAADAALHALQAEDERNGIHDETPEYLALNAEANQAALKLPRWRRGPAAKPRAAIQDAVTYSFRPSARRARIDYYAAATRAAEAMQQIEGRDGRTASGRARLISELAACESAMSVLIKACRWDTAEDTAMATEHHANANLLHILATTEVAQGAYARGRGPAEWEQAFGAVLDDLTAEHDFGRRAELFTRLYIAAHPVVGWPVAENIAALRTAYTRLALATATPQDQEATQ